MGGGGDLNVLYKKLHRVQARKLGESIKFWRRFEAPSFQGRYQNVFECKDIFY